MGLGYKGMDAEIDRVRARALYHTDLLSPKHEIGGRRSREHSGPPQLRFAL